MCNRNCACSPNECVPHMQELKVGEDFSSTQEWKKPPQPSERGDNHYSVLVGLKHGQGEPIWKSWGTLISDRHVLTNACQVGSDETYVVRASYNRDYEVLSVSRVAGDSALCILTLRESVIFPALSPAPVFNASSATHGKTCERAVTQQYSGAWSQPENAHSRHLVTEYPPQFKSPPGNYGSTKCGNFEVGGLGSGQALVATQAVRDYAVYSTKRNTDKHPTGGAPLHGRSKSPMASFHHQFVSSLRQYPNGNPKIASFFPEALELLKNLPPINNGSCQNESGQQTPTRPTTSYQRPQWAHRNNRRVSSAGTQHRKPESEEKLTRCMDYEKTKYPPVNYHAAAAQTNVMTATKQTGCRPRSVAERSQRMNVPAPLRPFNTAGLNSTNSRRCSSNSSCVSNPVFPAPVPPTVANCYEQSCKGTWSSHSKEQNSTLTQASSGKNYIATEYPPQHHEPLTGHGRSKVSNFVVGGIGSGPPFPLVQSIQDYALYSPKRTSSANSSKPADGCKNSKAWFEQQFMSGMKKCPMMKSEPAGCVPQDFMKKMEDMKRMWQCDNPQKPMSPCSHNRPQFGGLGSAANTSHHRKSESEEKITRCMDYEKMKCSQCSKHAASTQNVSNPTTMQSSQDV